MCYCCVSIILCRLNHRRFLHIVGSTVLSAFSSSSELLCKSVDSPVLHAATSPSQYVISSIYGSSQSKPYISPIPFYVAETIVQECGLSRFARFYVTIASISSIDGFSQSYLCDSLTGAVIFYGVSRNSCSQNPLVGFFHVDFDLCVFL